MDLFLTHFIVPVVEILCPSACCHIYFYTQPKDSKNFLLCTNPEYVTEVDLMQHFVNSKHVVPFPEKILLPETQTLFCNSEFVIWLADFNDCESNKKVLGKYNRATRTFIQAT